MKKVKSILAIGLMLTAITFASCKKETKTPDPSPVPVQAATTVNKGFEVFIIDLSTLAVHPTAISFRTSSGTSLTDSVSVPLSNFLSNYNCGDPVSGESATLKVKNQAAYKLEVLGVINSTITVLATFNFNADGSPGTASPGLATPSPALGDFIGSCKAMVVKI